MSNLSVVQQYEAALQRCRTVFLQKTHDYGTSWRVLRPASLTDQIWIKARRIRTIEEKGFQKVEDNVAEEYVGIVNYSLIALLQLHASPDMPMSLDPNTAHQLYDSEADTVAQLFAAKNHDYGNAWQQMRLSSFTDLILMKLLRIKQIEDLDGQTLASEGIDAGYRDIVNYAIFALIQLNYY